MVINQNSGTQRFLARFSETVRRDVMPIIGRLPAYGRLVYALTTSTELTAAQKSALILALGYQVSPVDLIPGFIPVIGQLDDLFVLLWGIRRTLDVLPEEQALAYLTAVQLTREQLVADAEVIRRALGETLSRSVRAAQRGISVALSAGVMGAAFLGYLTYYLVRGGRRA